MFVLVVKVVVGADELFDVSNAPFMLLLDTFNSHGSAVATVLHATTLNFCIWVLK